MRFAFIRLPYLNYRQEKGIDSPSIGFVLEILIPNLHERMIGQERESPSTASCPDYGQYQSWSSAHPNDASHIVLKGEINISTSQIAHHKIEFHNEYQHQI